MASETFSVPVPLQRLPLHLLEGICFWLSPSNGGGLPSFSLANRQCANAAIKFRLRNIHLQIGGEISDEDFTFMDKVPDIDTRLGFVRSLRIGGSQDFEDDAENFFVRPRPFRPSPKGGSSIPYTSPLPEEALQFKARYKENWARAARFISRLSCLSDLIYECSAQVPMCVLSALRDHCPDARLHVYKFSLDSLYQPRDKYHDISPEEYALATSPNIYGLYLKYCSYTDKGHIGYNEEAVIQMVRGLAPRLSYVYMASKGQGGTIRLSQAYKLHRHSGKPEWKGFYINDGQAGDMVHGRGSLHTLYFEVTSKLRIHQWCGYTDFSKLTKLHLGDTAIDAVQVLATIGEGGGLSSLSSLALNPDAKNGEQAIAADGFVSRLLRAIKPQQCLELGEKIGDGAWRAVTDHHGSSLRELRFVPARRSDGTDADSFVLSCDKIRLLSQNCSRLEKLELRVFRSRGDEDEVDIYRSLGRLPRLKRISLILECSVISYPDVRPGEPFIDMGGWEIPVSIYRAALINNAVDSVLAQSIFETMATTKTHAGGCSLVSLKLQIDGACNFGLIMADSETRIPLEWVGQSWLVRRDSPDGDIVVQNINSLVDDMDVLKDDFPERDDLKAVWVDVWPGSPGDRRNQWHSFPLVGSTN